MPFEIGFQGTTKTGNAKAFEAGVARAVARRQATYDLASETVTLENGASLQLVLDAPAGMALIIAEEMSAELSLFSYALADETATILQAMNLTAGTPSAGEPPALLLHLSQFWRMEHEDWLFEELETAFNQDQTQDEAIAERQTAVEKALAERRAALASGQPRKTPSLVQSRSSLFQRLSNALFGKSI